MSKAVKSCWAAFLSIILLLGLGAGYYFYSRWRDYPGEPPVRFRQNQDLALGLYPRGFQSAALFTNFGLSPSVSYERIYPLWFALHQPGMKGTFFIVPFDYLPAAGSFDKRPFKILRLLRANGHEIAQGDHDCLGDGAPPDGRSAPEKSCLSFREKMGMVKEGREILDRLGYMPEGYRVPRALLTSRAFRTLNELGYVYAFEQEQSTLTFRNALASILRRFDTYPRHSSGLSLLRITSHFDPTRQMEKAREVFKRCHRLGGVFTFHTQLPQVSEPENLNRLQEFVTFLQAHNTWFPTVLEFCLWWEVREKITMETKREGDTLIIVYRNPAGSPLKSATINFKEASSFPRAYQIMNTRGEIIAGGLIPASRRVNVTLLPDG